MRNALDLLAEYARYHRDERNIITHMIGVPLIVFAVGVLLAKPEVPVGGLMLTPAWVAFTFAAVWYLRRHLVLGLIVTAAIFALLFVAQHVSHASIGVWLAWGIGCFVLGWAFQFLGHYYEGRRPAYMDDVANLLVGPMFVAAELLFMAGWNKPMAQAIEDRVGPTRVRDLAHPA
jgi:uncharacterized membrane protein YGL010W